MPDNPWSGQVGTDNTMFGQTTLFKEQLDEVRIYNTALSAAEIRRLSIPPVSISRRGADAILSWPVIGPPLMLEATENFPGGTWSEVSPTPFVQDGRSEVPLPATARSQVFRLRKN